MDENALGNITLVSDPTEHLKDSLWGCQNVEDITKAERTTGPPRTGPHLGRPSQPVGQDLTGPVAAQAASQKAWRVEQRLDEEEEEDQTRPAEVGCLGLPRDVGVACSV